MPQTVTNLEAYFSSDPDSLSDYTTPVMGPRWEQALDEAAEWQFSIPMAAMDVDYIHNGRYVNVEDTAAPGVSLFSGWVTEVEDSWNTGNKLTVSIKGFNRLVELTKTEVVGEIAVRAWVTPKYVEKYNFAMSTTGQDLPEAYDDNPATWTNIKLMEKGTAFIEDEQYQDDVLEIAHEAPFDGLRLVIRPLGAGWIWVQNVEAEIQVEYIDDEEWAAVALDSNGTDDGDGIPFKQDGELHWATAGLPMVSRMRSGKPGYLVRIISPDINLERFGFNAIEVYEAAPDPDDIATFMATYAPDFDFATGSAEATTDGTLYTFANGETPLAIALEIAERSGFHFVLINEGELLWFKEFPASGAVAKMKVEAGDDANATFYIRTARRKKESRGLVTRIKPRGAGSDDAAYLNITPYLTDDVDVPAGYIVVPASGLIVNQALEVSLGEEILRVVDFPSVTAPANGTGTTRRTAAELTKAGLAWLQRNAAESRHWSLSGFNLPATIHAGMTIQVQASVVNESGAETEEIDEALVITSITTSIENGVKAYTLEVSNTGQHPPTAMRRLIENAREEAKRRKYEQPSSQSKIVGKGNGGAGTAVAYDPLSAEGVQANLDEHLLETTTAHGIPAQIDAKIATHAADDDAHHDPVTVAAPLTRSNQLLGLAVGNGIEVNGGLLRARPSDIAGDGLYASSTQLHILSGNGLQIVSDILLVDPEDLAGDGIGFTETQLVLSPSTISAASENAASGSGHTHEITATADADAAPSTLLKGDADGHIKLRDLTVEDDVAVGGNVNAGEYVEAPLVVASSQLRVGESIPDALMRAVGDVNTGTVRIRKAPELIEDEGITVDVGGVVRADWFMGQWATAVRGAAFIAHYNGSLGSSTGTNYTASGAVSYEESPFGSALQSYGTLVNLIKNPSRELVTTPSGTAYGTDGVLTLTRSDEWSYSGGWSTKLSNHISGNPNFYWIDTVSPLAASTTYTWSAVVRRAANGTVSAVQIRPQAVWGTGDTGVVADALYENLGGGAWRVTQTFTTGASAGTYFVLGLSVQAGYAAETWYFDSFVLVAGNVQPPIFDGASPGCTWSGTAHASTSTRTALNLQYESQNPDDWTRLIFKETEGSILAWVKLASITDADFRSILYLESGWGGPAISFALTPSGKPYVEGEDFDWTYEDAIPSGYVMLALTWSLTEGILVYVNGVLVFVDEDNGVYEGFQIVQGELFRVGDGLNGAIDSLVISTNELTAEEIERIYKANAPVFGVNMGGESRGFSAKTPNGRVWADSRGLHFANNEGTETGKQYIGEDGKSLINNDVEELRVADGTILLNADGMEVLAVDGAEAEVDVPTYNKLKFVNVAREVQSALFQHGNFLKYVSEPNDGGTTAGYSFRAISPLAAEILFEITAQGDSQIRARDEASNVIISADKTQFEAAKAGIKWTAGALTYKNVSAAVVTVGAAGADAAWVTPTLLNSWVDYGLGKSTAGYRLMPDGTVALKGVLSGSSATAVMFTLPAAYRPSETRRFAAAANSAVGIVEVTTAGNVSFTTGGSTTQSSLDGIRFPL
jgi:hypothetical protein